MSADPTSGRTLEINNLRRRLDDQFVERLNNVEHRLDSLDDRVRLELSALDDRIIEVMHRAENCIAEKAVKKAFGYLGVDVDDPKDLKRFQDDLRFGGVFRNAASRGFFAILAAVCGGIGLSFWLALQDHFNGDVFTGILNNIHDYFSKK